MKAIETQDVTFHYGPRFAIHHLNMNVHEGDVYGFLGPNGAGKTTTIRILLGLVKPKEGHIRIFGEDLHRKRLAVLARIGAHLEEHAFYPYLSGRDNLRLFAPVPGPAGRGVHRSIAGHRGPDARRGPPGAHLLAGHETAPGAGPELAAAAPGFWCWTSP